MHFFYAVLLVPLLAFARLVFADDPFPDAGTIEISLDKTSYAQGETVHYQVKADKVQAFDANFGPTQYTIGVRSSDDSDHNNTGQMFVVVMSQPILGDTSGSFVLKEERAGKFFVTLQVKFEKSRNSRGTSSGEIVITPGTVVPDSTNASSSAKSTPTNAAGGPGSNKVNSSSTRVVALGGVVFAGIAACLAFL